MSRSLAAAFITEKDRNWARPFNSVVFHFGGAIGDIRVDSHGRTIGGNSHFGVIERFGEFISSQAFRDGAFQVHEMSISMVNFPTINARRFSDLFSDVGIEGVEADVYQNFREIASTTIHQELLYKAACRPLAYDLETCGINLVSVATKYLDGKEISKPIEHGMFPTADLDDVGQRANIVYGAAKDVRCHAIVAGLQFALQAAMSVVSNSIEIGEDAYNALPSPGIVQIGDEQIAYTGKATSPNRLTGLTRQTNGTPLQSHAINDTIVQVLTEYVFLVAKHAVKSISNVRIWRNGLAYPLVAYSTELANTTRWPGETIAVVKVTAPPVIKELPVVELSESLFVDDGIAVVDSIGVQDTIGVSDNIAVIDNSGVNDGAGVSDTIGIDQPNRETQWEDIASDINVTFPATSINNDIQFQTITISATKTISSGNYVKRFSFKYVSGGMFGSSLYLHETNFLLQTGETPIAASFVTAVDGAVTLTLRLNRAGATQHPAVTFAVTSRAMRYAVDSTVTKTGSASKTGSVTKTGSTFKSGTAGKFGTATKTGAASKLGTVTLNGAVTLSSTSTAEVVLGEYLTCDVEGYADDGSGTWTGTPNALIEKPADVIHHLARTEGAVPSGYVDSAAFVTARTDAPASYKLACVFSERTNLKELLLALGMQSRIRCDWPVDKLTCRFLKSSYSAGKSVTQESIHEGSLSIQRDSADLQNIVNIFYGADLTIGKSVDAFQKLYRTQDAASIARYREQEQRERFLFEFIGASNDAMAKDIGDFYLAYYSKPQRVVTCYTGLDEYELLAGDIVNLTVQTAFFPASAVFAPGGGAPEITFDEAGKGIAAARGPEYFDGLTGGAKFIVDEFGVDPGSGRDNQIARMRLVLREVP